MSNKAFKAALSHVNTLQEFFDVCGEFYDLKNSKLGFISKAYLIHNIDKIIATSGAKPKK